MAVFVIGDLHLSFGCDKPMDIFAGWQGYQDRLRTSWEAAVAPEDTVVLAGDTSWGMTMAQSIPDFLWLDSLPGKKFLLKGNHDYWWGSVSSMKRSLAESGITTIDFLHNNSFFVNGKAICGSRGWLFENGQPHDAKILNREAIRIEASLKSAPPEAEKLLFLHYPPVYGDQVIGVFFEMMRRYDVRRCYYGHIHGAGHRFAIDGVFDGIDFRLISADYVGFSPVRAEI